MKSKRIKYFMVYGVLTSMLVFAQLLLGTDPLILLLAFFALFSVGLVLLIWGTNRLLPLLAVLILTQYSFFPFWIKTLIGQRLDLGLNNPYETFIVASVGSSIFHETSCWI